MTHRIDFSGLGDYVWPRGTRGATDLTLEQCIDQGALSKTTFTCCKGGRRNQDTCSRWMDAWCVI